MPTLIMQRTHTSLVSFKRQVLLRAPPKTVFQFLYDVTLLEEFTKWRVTLLGDEFGTGFQWRESRFLRKREWTVTEYDRRGCSFAAEWNGVTIRLVAKKGGTGSTNVQMRVDGDEAAVRKFERSDGDRLDRLKEFLKD